MYVEGMGVSVVAFVVTKLTAYVFMSSCLTERDREKQRKIRWSVPVYTAISVEQTHSL